DLSADYASMGFTTARRFDAEMVSTVLARLDGQCREFIAGPGTGSAEQTIEFSVEARYPHQIWEVEVPVRDAALGDPAHFARLVADVHATHRQLFAIDDPGSDIEFVTWRSRVWCRLRGCGEQRLHPDAGAGQTSSRRAAYFPGEGWVETSVE